LCAEGHFYSCIGSEPLYYIRFRTKWQYTKIYNSSLFYSKNLRWRQNSRMHWCFFL